MAGPLLDVADLLEDVVVVDRELLGILRFLEATDPSLKSSLVLFM